MASQDERRIAEEILKTAEQPNTQPRNEALLTTSECGERFETLHPRNIKAVEDRNLEILVKVDVLYSVKLRQK